MWYKHFGWSDNPFTVKPDRRLVGVEDEAREISEHLLGGNAAILTGQIGSGKSSMLRYMEKKITGHSVVYLNAEKLPEGFEILSYLRQKRSWWQKLLRREPKGVILMLDEGHFSSQEFKDELKVLYDDGVIKSLMIAQVKHPYTFSDGLKHRIGNRVVKLSPLSDSQVEGMVNVRTGNKHPFEPESLKTIARHASYNPRKTLEYLEAVAKAASREKLGHIGPLFAEETILGAKEQQIPDGALPEQRKAAKSKKGFTATQKRIIRVLMEGSRSPEELADILSSTRDNIHAHLTPLAEKGVVQRVGDAYAIAERFMSQLL